MLFKRELRKNLLSFIISCLVCSAMAMYITAIAPSFGKDIQQIMDLKIPKTMQTAIGMSGLDFSNAASFYAIGFSYIYLFIGIYLSGIFAVIVSKEFSEKTAEYLFSLPVRRLKIIYTKLSVVSLYALLIVVILFFASWLSFEMNIKEGYDIKPVLLMSVAWLTGGLTFGAIAFLLSSFFIKSRTIISISIGFVLAMYLMQVIISLNKNISFLKYISPFDWFKGSEIVNTGELSVEYVLIAIAVIVVSLFFGIRRFRKMDVLI